jgi:hypothetical protein
MANGTGWRAWNVARALLIALVVGIDLWLRSAANAQSDVRLEVLAALLILLIFAGRWRREEFELEPRDERGLGLALAHARADARAAPHTLDGDTAHD